MSGIQDDMRNYMDIVIEPSADPVVQAEVPSTMMSTPQATMVGRIGGLAQAIQAAFDAQDADEESGSYYDADEIESTPDFDPNAQVQDDEAQCSMNLPDLSDYIGNDEYDHETPRELLNDDDMAPKIDQYGHRDYSDPNGSSEAARNGMTG